MTLISRTLEVLDQMAGSDGAAGVTELALRLELPKSSIHRVLSELERCGYVDRDTETGRYVPGPGLVNLAYTVSQGRTVRSVAAPHLLDLLESSREVVHLAVYERGDCVLIDKLDSPHPVAPQSRVGVRAPSTCIATGLALLAFQPDREIDRVLARPLVRYTARTVTDPEVLRAVLRTVRLQGYAENHCSWREGVCGVAGPIRDHSGVTVASVGCCVPETRFDPAAVEQLRGAVMRASGAISAALGYDAANDDVDGADDASEEEPPISGGDDLTPSVSPGNSR